ncbi:hypothetical protein SNEBB_000267 [Seison nebaliae]|nr:hypothetical protein SNEBB_000267 [Seison nebaliae]
MPNTRSNTTVPHYYNGIRTHFGVFVHLEFCRNYQNGKCHSPINCNYIHCSEEEQRSYEEDELISQSIREQLRNDKGVKRDKIAKQICIDNLTNKCRRKSNCRYLHMPIKELHEKLMNEEELNLRMKCILIDLVESNQHCEHLMMVNEALLEQNQRLRHIDKMNIENHISNNNNTNNNNTNNKSNNNFHISSSQSSSNYILQPPLIPVQQHYLKETNQKLHIHHPHHQQQHYEHTNNLQNQGHFHNGHPPPNIHHLPPHQQQQQQPQQQQSQQYQSFTFNNHQVQLNKKDQQTNTIFPITFITPINNYSTSSLPSTSATNYLICNDNNSNNNNSLSNLELMKRPKLMYPIHNNTNNNNFISYMANSLLPSAMPVTTSNSYSISYMVYERTINSLIDAQLLIHWPLKNLPEQGIEMS